MIGSKILIVDDEPFNVDYLEQELEELGYETLSAANGQEALDKVASEAPDLILLDIMMPVMDGFEALARLKADPATRHLPVVVISASSDLRSVVRGIELGAEDYLPKPFEPALLQARISSGLERKRLRDLEQLYLEGLEREFEIAREIQGHFLPSELPAMDGWEIAATLKPAREVAGDFYDAFPLANGHVVFVVGDVCGKGVGAALFMTLFRSLIRITSTSDIEGAGRDVPALAPADLLQHVVQFTNTYVADTHRAASVFATVFIGIVNLVDGTLTYINGGNEPALVVKPDGTVTALRPTGPIVGVLPGARYAVKQLALGVGDLLLAFTDGIPDALNTENAAFGSERLLGLLGDAEVGPAPLLARIGDRLGEFIGPATQFDDITLLAVKRVA